jgi:hypothetical protein
MCNTLLSRKKKFQKNLFYLKGDERKSTVTTSIRVWQQIAFCEKQTFKYSYFCRYWNMFILMNNLFTVKRLTFWLLMSIDSIHIKLLKLKDCSRLADNNIYVSNFQTSKSDLEDEFRLCFDRCRRQKLWSNWNENKNKKN